MVTALDCAILSEDVYNRENNQLAASAGWLRVDAQNWGEGFAGGTYVKGNSVVVAFRGTETDDMQDIIADAHMVPSAPPDRILQVIPSLLREYDLSDSVELQLGGILLGGILVDWRSRALVGTYANQVPPEQTSLATTYVQSRFPRPQYVTGHSLGGALAKAISLQMNIPGVAFNSPFMGDLRGIPPISSSILKSINTRGDPLSLATEAAGNLSHGETILVDIPRFREPAPARPQIESYRRPSVCPRASAGNDMVENLFIEYIAEPACESALDMWEPVGRAASAPRRAARFYFNTYPEYVGSLLGYLGRAALYYHSMQNLRVKMQTLGQFRSPLSR
ncbi:MAG TPA: hypothetical protein VK995_06170 [Oceanipulchritudo sp.]|nr:hypothetical protein [Oceanipulchritudo sp.]